MSQRYLILYEFSEKNLDADGKKQYGVSCTWTKKSEEPVKQARAVVPKTTTLENAWISDMHDSAPNMKRVFGKAGPPPRLLSLMHETKVKELRKPTKPRMKVGPGGTIVPADDKPVVKKVKEKPPYKPFTIYTASSWLKWYLSTKEVEV